MGQVPYMRPVLGFTEGSFPRLCVLGLCKPILYALSVAPQPSTEASLGKG